MDYFRLSALMAIGTALAACAATPAPPVAELGAATAEVARVQPQGARYAPAHLLIAQQRLSAAQSAMDAENYERARRLSEQAVADARLVAAMTEAARARQVLAEIRQGNRALESELKRSVP